MNKSKNKKTAIIVITLAILAVLLGLYLGIPTQKTYVDYDFMGGISLQTIIKTNVLSQSKIGKQIYDTVDRIDKLINPTYINSDVYRINNSAVGEEIKVDPITIELLEYSKSIYELTNGLFTPTVYDLVDLWGFSAGKYSKNAEHVIPNDEQINAAIEKCRDFPDKILWNKDTNTVKRTTDTKIDLGGIAKGYAVEKCYKVFAKSDAKNGLVNLGGNVYTFNKDWKVGIENPYKDMAVENKPNETEHDILGVVSLNNLSVSCSGVYERNYIVDGKFYHHIINPFTGRPVELDGENIIMSAVIGTDGALCDAIATSAILLGSISLTEEFVNKFLGKEIKGVILVTKNRGIKVVGEVDFTFNKDEMTGFEILN